ncbi:MAG: hypothetical protein M1839_004590 [Geoglossum umbratile]|nr:MAG: hypothetical protein M1839_004590 [Geoglossum umbratile]
MDVGNKFQVAGAASGRIGRKHQEPRSERQTEHRKTAADLVSLHTSTTTSFLVQTVHISSGYRAAHLPSQATLLCGQTAHAVLARIGPAEPSLLTGIATSPGGKALASRIVARRRISSWLADPGASEDCRVAVSIDILHSWDGFWMRLACAKLYVATPALSPTSTPGAQAKFQEPGWSCAWHETQARCAVSPDMREKK